MSVYAQMSAGRDGTREEGVSRRDLGGRDELVGPLKELNSTSEPSL